MDLTFLLPVISGWLLFISAVAQYVFYLKKRKLSKKISRAFFILLALWIIFLFVWAVFRNIS